MKLLVIQFPPVPPTSSVLSPIWGGITILPRVQVFMLRFIVKCVVLRDFEKCQTQ